MRSVGVSLNASVPWTVTETTPINIVPTASERAVPVVAERFCSPNRTKIADIPQQRAAKRAKIMARVKSGHRINN